MFVIATHDGGFLPLMHMLAKLGKSTYWLGGEQACEKAEQLCNLVKNGLKQRMRKNSK